jgi:hypothetical protein
MFRRSPIQKKRKALRNSNKISDKLIFELKILFTGKVYVTQSVAFIPKRTGVSGTGDG